MVEVFNQHVSALVDTGAAVSCVAAEKFPHLIIHSSTFTSLVGADNRPLRVKGTTMMKLRVQDRECEQRFFVVEALTHPLILGVDCLAKMRCVLDCTSRTVRFGDPPNINVSTIAPESPQRLEVMLQGFVTGEGFIGGQAKCTAHEIRLKPDVKPIRQPLR